MNVSLEPTLKPLDGEQLAPTANSSESAGVDIKAGGFWGESRHECAFFDVRVIYPHARSHRHRSLPEIYRSQEQEKRRQYEERILTVERGTFTPLVFSATGGAGPAATLSLLETAGRQVCVTKVIFIRTHAELAKMSSVVCTAQIRNTLLAGRKNLEAGQLCFGASPA